MLNMIFLLAIITHATTSFTIKEIISQNYIMRIGSIQNTVYHEFIHIFHKHKILDEMKHVLMIFVFHKNK